MKFVAVLFVAFFAMASSFTAIDEFAEGNLKFTADLYREILKSTPNDNLIFSPLSIEIILALTRVGANGRTESELTTTLRLPNQQRTEEALRSLLPNLKTNEEDLKLLSANKMFLGKKFTVLEPFKKIATSVYDADTENLNFAKPEEAAESINQWVEHQTNNKIKNLIDPSTLDSATRLVLVNALYFSAKWETPFEKMGTRKENFYVSKSVAKQVDMMHIEDSFKYFECSECNAKFLELPYLGENLTMTIVLPNDKEGLPLLEHQIEKVLSSPKKYTWERVAVSLPKFKIETSLELKPILKNLGLTTIFSDGADLSGISNEGLVVSDVIQKAFINVTESGTEAAAATAVISMDRISDAGQPQSFNADHPFWFLIKTGNVLLFFGRFII